MTKKSLKVVIQKIVQEIRNTSANNGNPPDFTKRNPDSFLGWCIDASEIAEKILKDEGYNDFKIGNCYIDENGEEIEHCILYRKIKCDSGPAYYSGVIDMTAAQFHNTVAEKEKSSFRKYWFGKIPDKHSKKYYKINKKQN